MFTGEGFCLSSPKTISLFAPKCRKIKDWTCLSTLEKGHYAVSISTKKNVLREGILDLRVPLKSQWHGMVWQHGMYGSK